MPTGGFLGSWRYLWAIDRWAVISLALFMVALLVFLFRLPSLATSGGFDNLVSVVFGHLWTFSILLVFTWFTRTVSIRTLVSYWLVGALFVANVVLMIGGVITGVVGDSWVGYAFLLPLLEEGLKILPVAVFLFLSVRSGEWERTASDALVLGFAVGAGFAFTEEMLVGRSVGHGFGDGIWGLLFPTFAKIGGSGFLSFGPPRWAMAHAGWTAFIALSLGVAVMFRHRKVLWVLPVATFALVSLDHMLVNAGGTDGSIFNLLLARGKVPMWLFLAAIPTVIGLEILIIHRTTERLSGYFDPIPLTEIREVLAGPKTGFTALQLKNAVNYSRWRRSGILAIRRFQINAVADDHLSVLESTVEWLLTMRDVASPLDFSPMAERYDRSPKGVGNPDVELSTKEGTTVKTASDRKQKFQ